jgi:hypothetical protein
MIDGVSVEKLSINIDGDSTSKELRPRIEACEKWVVTMWLLFMLAFILMTVTKADFYMEAETLLLDEWNGSWTRKSLDKSSQ